MTPKRSHTRSAGSNPMFGQVYGTSLAKSYRCDPGYAVAVWRYSRVLRLVAEYAFDLPTAASFRFESSATHTEGAQGDHRVPSIGFHPPLSDGATIRGPSSPSVGEEASYRSTWK